MAAKYTVHAGNSTKLVTSMIGEEHFDVHCRGDGHGCARCADGVSTVRAIHVEADGATGDLTGKLVFRHVFRKSMALD